MKILFLVGSAEPGKDGVGDYTARLAGAVVSLGHDGRVVALHDPHGVARIDATASNSVDPARLHDRMPWSERIQALNEIIESFRPDWVSLQYVPYAYHPKGLPLGLLRLPAIARKFPGIRWHLMIHELWAGVGAGDALAKRMAGIPQRAILKRIVNGLRIQCVHYNLPAYGELMKRRLGIIGRPLPLFGNIPVAPGDPARARELVDTALTSAGGSPLGKDDRIIPVFGVAKPHWPFESFATILGDVLEARGERAVVVFIGRGQDAFRRWFEQGATPPHPCVRVAQTGFLSESDISRLFQISAFGISVVSLAMVCKSGVVAAMKDHGLNVLVLRDDVRIRGILEHPARPDGVHTPDEVRERFDAICQSHPPEESLPRIAQRFLEDLEASASTS